MILTLIVQIVGGLIALIPLGGMVAVTVWGMDFSYTGSFRNDLLYADLPETIRVIRGVLGVVSAAFGVVLGYLILAEILGAFVSWGFIGSAESSLAGILQAWILIALILAVLAILRGAGWLSFKLFFKRKPIRVKREDSEPQPTAKDDEFTPWQIGRFLVGLVIATVLVVAWFGVQQHNQNSFIQQ